MELEIPAIQRLGFASMELLGLHEEHLATLHHRRENLRQALKAHGMRVPFLGVIFPGLASLKKEERLKNMEGFQKACELAEYLGAGGIVDYAPMPPLQLPLTTKPGRHYEQEILHNSRPPRGLDWTAYWRNLIDTYRQVCDLAAQRDLVYHIHPYPGLLVSNTDAFLLFQEEVGRGNLRYVLDIAHHFLQRENLVLALFRLKDYLEYIHISDNSGERIEHLEPGQGKIRLDLFFEALVEFRYKGYIGIDIGSEAGEVVNLEGAYGIAAAMTETFLGLS